MLKFLKYASYILVLVGAINWGLVGVFKFNLVAFLLGDMTRPARLVYALVGLSAVVSAITTYACCASKNENM